MSPAFDAINVAVTGLGFATAAVPSATLQAITTLVQAADIIAKETYTRSRTNTFLTQCNARFFNPQGLYALLMTYQPANADAVHRIDISSTIARTFGTSEAAKGSGANPAKNAPTLPVAEAEGQEEHALSDKVKAQLKLWTGRSSGVSRGEAEMPAAVAPLVYPGLDEASAEQKASWYSRGLEFTRDYFDRREAAKWVCVLFCSFMLKMGEKEGGGCARECLLTVLALSSKNILTRNLPVRCRHQPSPHRVQTRRRRSGTFLRGRRSQGVRAALLRAGGRGLMRLVTRRMQSGRTWLSREDFVAW